MLTGKQRAKLRAMANQIPALYQVGKKGLRIVLSAKLMTRCKPGN